MKVQQSKLWLLLSCIVIAAICVVAVYAIFAPNSSAASHKIQKTLIKPVASNKAPTIIHPTLPGTPTLQRLELITNNAFGNGQDYIPNSWGVQKSRIIRLSTGDLFTFYMSQGSDEQNREWHLMRRSPTGSWHEVNHGNAGAEPINILRGLYDEIHLFTWPGADGQALHLVSTDMGKTFTSEVLQGQWYVDQGYSGASINDKGDIVFFETAADKPGKFLWTYYNPDTKQWSFHSTQIDYRYTYAFFFPGDNGDLTITGMRDALREELNYTKASDGDFDYVFDTVKYFYIRDITHPALDQQTTIKHVTPQSTSDYDLTYITDSYIDTQGRTHVLYSNLYDGAHHAILENGQLIKDVKIKVSAPNKMRITQDTQGHFYILSVDDKGHLNVYPGTAEDTDGTQLEPAIHINISKYPGCSNDDFCHSPTFTVPRSGNALSNTIDGTYGNFQQEIYFRLQLRGSDNSAQSANLVIVVPIHTTSSVLLTEVGVLRRKKETTPH